MIIETQSALGTTLTPVIRTSSCVYYFKGHDMHINPVLRAIIYAHTPNFEDHNIHTYRAGIAQVPYRHQLIKAGLKI